LRRQSARDEKEREQERQWERNRESGGVRGAATQVGIGGTIRDKKKEEEEILT
jgi:hypothetical protein